MKIALNSNQWTSEEDRRSPARTSDERQPNHITARVTLAKSGARLFVDHLEHEGARVLLALDAYPPVPQRAAEASLVAVACAFCYTSCPHGLVAPPTGTGVVTK